LTPIEEYHVQEYLPEIEDSITTEFVKDILESEEIVKSPAFRQRESGESQ
jgi:hypothetical protein